MRLRPLSRTPRRAGRSLSARPPQSGPLCFHTGRGPRRKATASLWDARSLAASRAAGPDPTLRLRALSGPTRAIRCHLPPPSAASRSGSSTHMRFFRPPPPTRCQGASPARFPRPDRGSFQRKRIGCQRAGRPPDGTPPGSRGATLHRRRPGARGVPLST